MSKENKDVLLIDDEKWYLEPYLEKLDHEGITYDYCTNGEEGIAKIKSTTYKVIVLDIMLPLGESLESIVLEIDYEFPGLNILEEIRKIKADLPVICYTIGTGEELKSNIAKLGGSYLAKGSNANELISAIKKLLGTK